MPAYYISTSLYLLLQELCWAVLFYLSVWRKYDLKGFYLWMAKTHMTIFMQMQLFVFDTISKFPKWWIMKAAYSVHLETKWLPTLKSSIPFLKFEYIFMHTLSHLSFITHLKNIGLMSFAELPNTG